MNRNILGIVCAALLLGCLYPQLSIAQLHYSTIQYSVRTQPGINFDTQPNYCGRSQQLNLNIYKPIGDGNLQRPVIIFIHGGAFTSTTNENDGDMVAMARQFASRGYVAVSMHYREGIHLFNYSTGNPSLTGTGVFAATFGLFSRSDIDRLYASDSAEILRAGYRAQQDLKSAIRFMKGRAIADSSAPCKFFIAGHSAGAITVLAAAFLDEVAEKPTAAGTLSDAENPLWTNTFLQLFGPAGQDDAMYRNQNPTPFNFNAASCYVRTDLGDIHGAGNLNGENVSVIGIGSMAGAIQDTNFLAGTAKPAVFLYHIPNDVVVPYNSGRPFGIAATFMSPSPNEKWPTVYGTTFIQQKLQNILYPSPVQLQTFDNGGDDLTSHSILPSTGVVSDSMARFFARVLDTSTACNVVLPLSLQFAGGQSGNAVVLKWIVSQVSGKYDMILERSADGVNFIPISSSIVATAKTYKHTDVLPLPVGYYRLKQISVDGRITYSKTIVIKLGTVYASTIFPNPAHTHFSVALAADANNAAVTIELQTLSGQVIERKTGLLAGSTILINVGSFASGIYVCKILYRDYVETKQVLVQ